LKEAYHFKSTRYAHKPVSAIEAKDTMKQVQAQQQGLTLITIPFWWDRTPQRCALLSLSFPFLSIIYFNPILFVSLIATIKTVRPDLLSHISVSSPPIPLQMPQHLKQPTEFVEDIGEPITACFLSSAVDPTGW
jgi:hypothetical protein